MNHGEAAHVQLETNPPHSPPSLAIDFSRSVQISSDGKIASPSSEQSEPKCGSIDTQELKKGARAYISCYQ